MSKTLNYIVQSTTDLITSAIEQAIKEAQTPAESDEINDSLNKIKEENHSKCDHGVVFDIIKFIASRS
jgi:hypothetical protein